MPRRKGNQKSSRRGGRRNVQSRSTRRLDSVVPRPMVTNRVRTWLTFVDLKTINAAGSPTVGKAYQPTAAYDVDPDLGSTSTSGFSEWAAMYQFYRVSKFRVDLMVANKEAFFLLINTLASNTTLTDSSNLALLMGSKHFHQTQISSVSSGMPLKRFSRTYDVCKIVGSRAPLFDDNYASTTAANPSNNVFWAVQIYSPTAVLVAGAVITVRISMLCEFYESKNLSS